MNRSHARALLAAAAVAMLLAMAQGADKGSCKPIKPEEPVCVKPDDCEGLPHMAIPGAWSCVQGECVWKQEEPTCLKQGEKYMGDSSQANCCEGLAPIEYAEYWDGECAYVDCLCYVCAACGNGLCEEGENPCNCETDCPASGQCDDGKPVLCNMVPPMCPAGTIVAARDGCWECVDPETCLPPGAKCKALVPGSHGACEMIIGWMFNGKECVMESGCGCGEDCAYFFDTEEECADLCLGGGEWDLPVEKSECLDNDFDGLGDGGAVWVEGDTIFLAYQDEFNCCSTVTLHVVQEGYALSIYEEESGQMCFCLCDFDVATQIDGMEPGTYTIVIYKDGKPTAEYSVTVGAAQ